MNIASLCDLPLSAILSGVMARECGPPSWVLHNVTKQSRSSFFEQKSKRHLGGPHSRAMTIFLNPITANSYGANAYA
jgi:hypothetical protein